MPAIGNIVVNDSAAVAHTFAPVTTDGALAKLANRTAITPAGFETLVVEVKPPAGAAGAHRVRIGLGDPVEATVSGVTNIDHLNSGELVLNFSQKSTALERKDILKLFANLANHATVIAVCENVEPIY